MIKIIIESFISVFECVIAIGFVTLFLGSKFNKKKGFLLFILFLSVDIVFAIFRDRFGWYSIVHQIYPITYYFIYANICLKGTISKKLFISCVALLSNMLINLIVPPIISYISGVPIVEMAFSFNAMRIFTLFTTKFLYLFVAILILKINKMSKYDLTNEHYKYLAAIELLSLFIAESILTNSLYITVNSYDKLLYIFASVGLITCNILFFALMKKINDLNIEKANFMLVKKENDFQNSYVRNSVNTYEKAKTIKHDLNNHFNIISILLNQNKIDRAKEYISQFINVNLKDLIIMVNSGNSAIDAVIGSKMEKCKPLGIEIFCSITTSPSKKHSMDVCTVLANALDNAIEASKNVSNPYIDISIQRVKTYLSITVVNRIETSVLQDNPNLNTTKSDAEIHGFGTKSIKSIAQKYNGSVLYHENKKKFNCNILLEIFN